MRKSQILGVCILVLFGIALLFLVGVSDHKLGEYRIVIRVHVNTQVLEARLRTYLGSWDGVPIVNSSTIVRDGMNITLVVTGLSSYERRPGNKFWVYVHLYVDSTPISSFGDLEAKLIGPDGAEEDMIYRVENDFVYAYKTVRVNSIYAFLVFMIIVVIWALTATSPLLVALLIPILGIIVVNLPAYDVLSAFWDPSVALIFGALILAFSMHKTGLAERITYIVLSRADSPSKVLVYLSIIAYFLSMWMSSLGSMLVMLPIIATVLKTMNAREGSYYARGLTLSTMIASIFGGASTIVGNPANALVASIAYRYVGIGIGFLEWMIIAVPLTFTMVLLLDVVILRFFPIKEDLKRGYVSFDSNTHMLFGMHLMGLGPWTREEKITLSVFIGTVAGWIVYSYLYIMGFTHYMQFVAFSLIAGFVLLITDVFRREDLLKIRWDILLALGGSLSLAVIIEEAGVLELLILELKGMNTLELTVLIFAFLVILAIILGPLVGVAIGMPIAILSIGLSSSSIVMFSLAASAVVAGPNGLVFEENVRERGFLKYKDYLKWSFIATILISTIILATMLLNTL